MEFAYIDNNLNETFNIQLDMADYNAKFVIYLFFGFDCGVALDCLRGSKGGWKERTLALSSLAFESLMESDGILLNLPIFENTEPFSSPDWSFSVVLSGVGGGRRWCEELGPGETDTILSSDDDDNDNKCTDICFLVKDNLLTGLGGTAGGLLWSSVNSGTSGALAASPASWNCWQTPLVGTEKPVGSAFGIVFALLTTFGGCLGSWILCLRGKVGGGTGFTSPDVLYGKTSVPIAPIPAIFGDASADFLLLEKDNYIQ